MSSVKLKRLRELDAETLELMTEHFVFPSEDSLGPFLRQLVQALEQSPQQVYVASAWRGEMLIGFVIAWDTPVSVFVSQFWSAQGNPPVVADRLFLQVLIWAQGLGRDRVVAETQRDTGALFERAGFTERSVMVEYDMSGFSKRLMGYAKQVFKPEEAEVLDG